MAQYITAFVLQKYDTQFAPIGGAPVGALLQVATPDNGGVIDGDMWAIPVNRGVYSGWQFLPYNPNNPAEATQPPYAVPCVRISSRFSSDVYWVLGTAAQYVAASAGGTATPQVWPTRSHTVPLLPVCEEINELNSSNQYVGTFGVPSLSFGQNYFPFGFLNDVALTDATGNGYADLTALLVFLNASWSSVGTWTKTADNLTLIVTQSAGTGTDIFCGGFIPVSPSL